MRFSFTWWRKYYPQLSTLSDTACLEFLSQSLLEAETFQHNNDTYLHCSPPYQRRDCKHIHGITRFCYECLSGDMLPAACSSQQDKAYWIPTKMPHSDFNFVLFHSKPTLTSQMSDMLKINGYEDNPSCWIKLLAGEEASFFSISPNIPIEELKWNSEHKIILQGEQIIEGQPAPHSDLSLLVTTSQEESYITQYICHKDFASCIHLQHATRQDLAFKTLQVDKSLIIDKLGYLPCLKSLQMYLHSDSPSSLVYNIPAYYKHIQDKDDLIEELASRSMHRTNITGVSSVVPLPSLRESVTKMMMMRGYNEVKNFSMISEEESARFKSPGEKIIKIQNPMSLTHAYLRSWLIPGMLGNLSANINRHKAQKAHLFEIGKVFKENQEVLCLAALSYGSKYQDVYKVFNSFAEILGDMYSIIPKEHVELRSCKLLWLSSKTSASVWVKDRCIGYIGQISPVGYHHKHLIKNEWQGHKKHILPGLPFIFHIELEGLPEQSFALKPLPEFPSIYKDITITCAYDHKIEDISSKIKSLLPQHLVHAILKDIFYKSDKEKKLTFELEFNGHTRTLSWQEIKGDISKLEAMSFLSEELFS